MKVVTSSRRQIVMAVLLALAALGAAIRHWADNPSLARDIGTLLLVLWLPAVGNLVAFVIRKFPRRTRQSDTFFEDRPFIAHLAAEVTAIANDLQELDPLERRCMVLLGNEGFTARSALPLSQWLGSGNMQTMEFELLRPEPGSRRLAPGDAFHVLRGTAAVAEGRVIETYFAAVPAGL
jgi:hypothetical protein